MKTITVNLPKEFVVWGDKFDSRSCILDIPNIIQRQATEVAECKGWGRCR